MHRKTTACLKAIVLVFQSFQSRTLLKFQPVSCPQPSDPIASSILQLSSASNQVSNPSTVAAF